MTSLRRLAPRFIDWRLSRIDEELDRVSCASSEATATTPPSPSLPPPPPLLFAGSAPSTDNDDEPPPPPPPAPDLIYSNAGEWRKAELERSAVDDERDAVRYIKEKYDSLGSLVFVDKSDCAVSVPQPVVLSVPASTALTSADSSDQAPAVYQNVPRIRPSGAVEISNQQTPHDVTPVTSACTATATSSMQMCNFSDGQLQQPTVRRQLNRSHAVPPPVTCHHHNHAPSHQQQQRQQQSPSEQRQTCAGPCVPRSPLTESELLQVELFYRSYRTCVHVCTCMATLSFTRPVHRTPVKTKTKHKTSAGSRRETDDDNDDGVWACVRTGIPVIVHDLGDGRRRRRLYVLLAERGTGFELWRAPLDRLSDYTPCPGTPGTCYQQHTMRLAVDDTTSVTARLAFDDQPGADEFYEQLARQANDVINASATSGNGHRSTTATKSRNVISKSDISQPCCFSHVTRLERGPACRGRSGLHIVVATGRHLSTSGDGGGSVPDLTTSPLHVGRQLHSSFKTDGI